MPTFTPEQIDVAVPNVPTVEPDYVAGQPRRDDLNEVLKAARTDIAALETGKADATATSTALAALTAAQTGLAEDIAALETGKADATATTAALAALTAAQTAQADDIAALETGKVSTSTLVSPGALPDAGAPTDKILTIREVAGVPTVFEQTRAQFEAATVKASQLPGGGIAVQVGGRGVPLATTNARRLVIDGDSIGAQGWTSNATSLKYSNHGWWVHALAQKGWPLKVVAVSAVPSETSSQILARFASSVAAYGPAEVWAIIGQNNLGDGDGGAQCLADIRAYADACRNIGARLRLGTVTPRTTAAMTATIKTNILRINAGIVAMAREGLFSVFDSYSALVDPASADGASRSGVQIDTVHPNALGAYWIGREFALSQTDLPSVYSSPIGNLDTRLTNAASARLPANPKCSGSGGTVGTGGSGTAAASWNLNRQSGSALTVAGAVETDSADPGTTWQRMTFGGTVASGVEIVRFQQSVSLSSLAAAIVPGVTKIIGARCRVKSSSLPASLQYVRMTIETLNAVPAVTYTANGMADSSYQLGVFPSAEQVIECPPDFVIPADTTSVRITLNVAFGVGAASGDLWVTDIDVLTDAM